MNAFISAAVIAESDINSVLNNGLSFSEKASLSLKMILMGMGTVFAVLFIIWVFLTIFRLVMDKAKGVKKNKAPVTAAPAPVGTDNGNEPDEGALIAAITAAVTAYREEEGSPAPSSFRVVSFEKRGASRPWKKNR
ncbi:MAG: OadG family protein [Clostridia bacterium]|nr:OadG family protein [Clostridia bacterium]